MPLYDYECSRCGRVIEVLADYGDPPPVDDAECTSGTLIEDDQPAQRDCANEQKIQRREPCQFEGPLPCVQHQRWRGEPGNEGRGGWTMGPGDVMTRVSKGRSHEDRKG